ncbi:MAG TPA: hypothetical protein VK176_02220 [Phycisphaerales bacterium]|nr:hypothetical protein [Phycisphaerales bacterium]
MTQAPNHSARGGGSNRRDPVAMILGEEAAGGGPWRLLGLVHGTVEERAIVAALEARLATVNRHPLGGIPEADEVRLALHTAAAQLMHPGVRATLLEREQPGERRGTPAVGPDDGEIDPVLMAIAMHGGVNERSLRRIMMVTGVAGQGRDATASEIQRRVMAYSHRHRGAMPSASARGVHMAMHTPENAGASHAKASVQQAGTPRASRSKEDDPGARAIRTIVLTALGVIGSASAVMVGVMLLLNQPTVPPGGSPADSSSPEQQTRPKELYPERERSALNDVLKTPEQGEGEAPAVADDAGSVAHRIAAYSTKIATDPEGTREAIVRDAGLLSRRWAQLAADELGAAQDAIVECLYRAPSPEIAGAIADAVLAPSTGTIWNGDRVHAELWRSGMVLRLAREKDFPASLREHINELGAGGLRSDEVLSFARGALGRLSSLPAEMVAPTDPAGRYLPPTPAQAAEIADGWAAWRRACRQLTGDDAGMHDRLLITGLETILAEAPEPASDYGFGEPLKEIVLALSWRKDSIARPWLIASFSSSELSAPDLELVTRTLASSSSAEGVDGTMVLAPGADELRRLELRDAYAHAWGLSDPARRDELLEAWRAAAGSSGDLAAVDHAADEHAIASLAGAVTKARLNLAASMIWAGLIEEPALVIRDPGSLASGILSRVSATATPQRLDDGATDGSWGVQYMVAEQRVPDRLRLLSELSRANRPPGQMDAEILVAEALRGSPEAVRSTARDLMEQWSQTPAVLYAMLEDCYRIPKTRTNSILIASITMGRLPSIRDPQWYSAVRRAIIDQLLEVLASQGPDRAIDLLAFELQRTCSSRAKPSDTVLEAPETTSAGSEGNPAASPPPQASARGKRRGGSVDELQPIMELESQWKRSAGALLPTGREPVSPEQIDRRLAARLALGNGPVDEFAAHHLAVVELMSFVISLEQPLRAERVREILEELGAARRNAHHIFEQIEAAERAMLELWKIRFEKGVA